MNIFLQILRSPALWKKIVAISLFVLTVYILSPFLPIFLVAFIFSYLFLETGTYLYEQIIYISKHQLPRKYHYWIKKYCTVFTIITLLYVIFLILLIIIFVKIIPQIIVEIEKLTVSIPEIVSKLQKFIEHIEINTGMQIDSQSFMQNMLNENNMQETGKTIIASIRDTSGFILKFLIGMILSYIFIVDESAVKVFFSKMKTGTFGFIYNEFSYILQKLGTGFGKVFKAQSIIALVNAILTTVGLLILGKFLHGGGFPYIFTLSFIVFIFGFVPVLGTFLSGIPIFIIGYGIGGIHMGIGIIIMISVIHAIEAYILNPKIVSSYVHFPIFITFLILIISEHFFGFVGLLIGVPLFSIIISVFSDINTYLTSTKKSQL